MDLKTAYDNTTAMAYRLQAEAKGIGTHDVSIARFSYESNPTELTRLKVDASIRIVMLANDAVKYDRQYRVMLTKRDDSLRICVIQSDPFHRQIFFNDPGIFGITEDMLSQITKEIKYIEGVHHANSKGQAEAGEDKHQDHAGNVAG